MSVQQAIIKAGSKVLVSGHDATVVRILHDGVLVRVGGSEVKVDFSAVEEAVFAR